MVYPSGYHLGIPGFRNPVQHPYEVVQESVRLIRQRSQNPAMQVRPWLQDFKDYAFDRRIFGARRGHGPRSAAPTTRAARAGCCGTRGTTTPAAALRPKTAALTKSHASSHAYRRRGRPARGLPGRGASSRAPRRPTLPPNELGRVMILEYHKIDYPEDRWTRTPENFRRDLRDASGSAAIALWRLNDYLDGKITLPAGTTPVVLTFDDSSPGQFRYLEQNGTTG